MWRATFVVLLAAEVTATIGSASSSYEDTSIAEFQWLGSLQSNRIRSLANAPPIKGYDWSKYSITDQLDTGIRGLDIDILGCNDESGQCSDFISTDTQFFVSISNCETLGQCVTEVAEWSLAHKNVHFPIFIKIETESGFLSNKWTNFESFISLVNLLEGAVLQVYSDSNPIFNYIDFDSSGHTWDNIALTDLRGKIIFYLTPGDTEYLLDRFGEFAATTNDTESVATVNGWPESIAKVLFSQCTRRNFDDSDRVHCAFIQNSASRRIIPIREEYGNRYIFTSLVDSNFIQLENHKFEIDESSGDVTSVFYVSNNDNNLHELTLDEWLYQTWFDNLKLANSSSIFDPNPINTEYSCVITSISYIIREDDIANIAANNANGVSLCDLYDFVAFWNGDESDAQNVVSQLAAQNISLIGDVDTFANEVYTVFGEVDDLDRRLIFDKTEQLVDSFDVLNAPSNLLYTGYPYGTDILFDGIDESYKFYLDLGCNKTDVDPDESSEVSSEDPTEEPTAEPTEEPTEESIESQDDDEIVFAIAKIGNVCLYNIESDE